MWASELDLAATKMCISVVVYIRVIESPKFLSLRFFKTISEKKIPLSPLIQVGKEGVQRGMYWDWCCLFRYIDKDQNTNTNTMMIGFMEL